MSELAADAERAVTAGELLKAARERQGVHLGVLAAGLKVAQRKLELLEANRYDELLDATFVRALALSVCRSLKIDPEPVLARLPQTEGATLLPKPGLNATFRERGRDVRSEPGEWRRWLSWPLVAALLLVGAALLMSLWPSGGWRTGGAGDAASSGSDPASAASVAASEPAPMAEAASTAAVAASAADGAASAVVETVFAASPVASAPADALVLLRASAESWIEVRDAAGALLLSRTLAAGEAVGLDGPLPLRVVIGNAAATELLFRGKPVSLGPPTRENVARLELK